MRRLSSEELKVCAFQGMVFQASAQTCDCGSAVFIRRFMNSRVASRMDADGLAGTPVSVCEVFDQLDGEYGSSAYGSERYSPDELHWIGYVYRYWCCCASMRSKAAFKVASGRKMRDLYAAYHTFDPVQAVERILEADGVVVGEDSIERGVRVLRGLRAHSS